MASTSTYSTKQHRKRTDKQAKRILGSGRPYLGHDPARGVVGTIENDELCLVADGTAQHIPLIGAAV